MRKTLADSYRGSRIEPEPAAAGAPGPVFSSFQNDSALGKDSPMPVTQSFSPAAHGNEPPRESRTDLRAGFSASATLFGEASVEKEGRFSVEQIIAVLKQAALGMPVA